MTKATRVSLAATAFLFSLLSLCVAAQVEVQVPLGTAPTLDGTIVDGEWDDALAIDLSVGARLYLKHADERLFLAVRGETMGIPSPLILRGEDIHVLHASAALGTAIYSLEDGQWIQTQAFRWHCRLTGFSSVAVAQREEFLENEGWLGTIGRLGARTHFELMIDLDEPFLQMLFLFMEATSSPVVLSWPLASEDATPYLPLITGPIPDEIDVDLATWAILKLGPMEQSTP